MQAEPVQWQSIFFLGTLFFKIKSHELEEMFTVKHVL